MSEAIKFWFAKIVVDIGIVAGVIVFLFVAFWIVVGAIWMQELWRKFRRSSR